MIILCISVADIYNSSSLARLYVQDHVKHNIAANKKIVIIFNSL